MFYLSRRSFGSIFATIQQFAAKGLTFASLFGLVVLSQLLWCAWQARALNATVQLHRQPVSSTTPQHRTRVIWILLDELSYQQVYDQRFPGLRLPEFDHLAAQSTIFTHAIPTGISTEIAVPSLLTGLPIDRIRLSADGRLRALHNPEAGKWEPFDPHQTVFQDALDSGYSTGVAGWYNPYCRILAQVLDRCFWVFRNMVSGGIDSDQSLRTNLLGPIERFIAFIQFSVHRLAVHSWSVTSSDAGRGAEMHIADYRDLYAAADKLLMDTAVDFVYLHMPIPHPGGIYDRRGMQLSTGHSSYLDNLVLADQYLAHVRHILEWQGLWDSSVIVVMGDHSWRTKLFWSTSPDWMREEDEASHGGQFDDRPAYIVKMQGQQGGSRIDGPFAAVQTRRLLDGILLNRLRNASDLQTWVRQQH
jgi:hypothetical protein